MTDNLSTLADSALVDPYEMIISDMSTDPNDAMALAQFVDTSAIVKVFKDIGWTIEREVNELGSILTNGSATQKLAAMSRLNNIKDRALASRGIFIGASGPPGSTDPLALPGGVSTVEMTEKTVKMTRENTAGLAKTVENKQPLMAKEIKDDEENDEEGQDAFYEDERGTTANIFRAATVDIGCSEDSE